jgi:predicted MPP superfamily phosphohydrolase
MHKFSFIVFFAIALGIYFGMHYYIYHRIVSGLGLAPEAAVGVRIVLLLGALMFVLGEFLSSQVISPWIKPFTYLGSVWLGVISIALTVFVVRDIAFLMFRTPAFRYYSALVSLALIFVLSAYSVFNVWAFRDIKEIKVTLPKLPAHLSGFSIVQLSDIHLNYIRSPQWFKRIVDETNRLNPDVIVITGDLVDADLCRASELAEGLKELKAKYGVYAVTGNHEYYTGIGKYLHMMKQVNIPVLQNEHTTVAGAIELAGVNDPDGKRFTGGGPDIGQALSSPNPVDRQKPIVLLSHRPELFDTAAINGVDLQLSGHYHAGQIPPLDLIVMIVYKYPYGLYKNGLSYLYTTAGTGFWGPPMRLFSKSEIVKVTLTTGK